MDVAGEYGDARESGLDIAAASEAARSKLADYFSDEDDGLSAAIGLAMAQLNRDGQCLARDAGAALAACDALVSDERLDLWGENAEGRRAAVAAAREQIESAPRIG